MALLDQEANRSHSWPCFESNGDSVLLWSEKRAFSHVPARAQLPRDGTLADLGERVP